MQSQRSPITSDATSQQEPWLRGTLQDVPALPRAVLHVLQMALEDVVAACEGLSDEELCARPGGISPLSFHLRHIPGSLDRLLSYAEGKQLTEAQKATLQGEMAPGVHRAATMASFLHGMHEAAERVSALDLTAFDEPRFVGRKQLPTTVAGLVIHCADHTSRHVGQVVTTAKLLKSIRGNAS